jgi:dihydrofolate reductase
VDIALVVAMSRDGLIGREGALPWKLPRDLKHFRRLTWGKPIIMGRKTHETLGRPLPGRTNIVLTRRVDYHAAGCLVAHDRAEALAQAEATGANQAMIIGGSEVYREFLPLCQTVHLTLVEGQFEGNVFFPAPLLNSPGWKVIHEDQWPADAVNGSDAIYIVMQVDDGGQSMSPARPPGRCSLPGHQPS